MRTTKEIESIIQEERSVMIQHYAQINMIERSIEALEKEHKEAEIAELDQFVQAWMKEKFGICTPTEAEVTYSVFDWGGEYVRTMPMSSIKPSKFQEYLDENRCNAQLAVTFYGKSREWYDLPLKDQLLTLGWIVRSGMLCKTQC